MYKHVIRTFLTMKKRPTRREPETAHHRGLKITFDDNLVARSLFGEQNRHLRQIADVLAIQIHARGNTVTVHGDDIATQLVKRLLNELYGLIEEGYPIYEGDIDYAIRILSSNDRIKLKNIFLDTVYITSQKRPITPKGLTQKEYIDTMRKFDIVFAIGPAGTGKTYLAMAMAVSFLTKGDVNRVILTRPAVEAGESLGFLPGDLYEKVNPI